MKANNDACAGRSERKVSSRGLAGTARLSLNSMLLPGLLCVGLAAPTVTQAGPGCATNSEPQVICGVGAPEDLELLPDKKYVLMSSTPGLAHAHRQGLRLMHVDSKVISDLPIKLAPKKGWGDQNCPAPTQAIGSHGIHLSKKADGNLQLLVVNHAGREAIEFLQLFKTEQGWRAVWRGCVENKFGSVMNDVVSTADGGFVATASLEIAAFKADPQFDTLLDGRNTGYLVQWRDGGVLTKIPGSDAPFPNGIQLSPDGRVAWFALWTANAIRLFDLKQQRTIKDIPLGFMPDNLSLSEHGSVLVTGILLAETFRECYLNKTDACQSAFSVAEISQNSNTINVLHEAPEGWISGASVAIQVERGIYVGSFTGDRMLYLASVFPEVNVIDR
ncbi:SMP-30/gluconolactonase/LRE family protein [Pseudomonas hunanensis]|nr:hypothetical protein [Pseudomonas hunanensis]